MIRWRSGRVVARRGQWGSALELDVALDLPASTVVRALAYTDMVGVPQLGEQVLLNVTALDLDLGTGGYAFVAAVSTRLPDDPTGPGHLVKARYTPLQMTVLGVDEQDSPHHEVLRDADDLGLMPVVVADLHSSLPAIAAGVRDLLPGASIAYVATDGGALPLAFSRTVHQMRAAGWITGTVTVGQAFGGDYEAVTVHNGLLTARHVMAADVAIVSQGPGNLGTGTRWGFSGVAAGEAINAAAVLNGRPVAALRVSGADQRTRHFGVSHHSLTAYGRVAAHPADVVVPVLTDDLGDLGDLGDLAQVVRQQAASLSPPHVVVEESVEGLMAALAQSPVPLSTMGRDLAADPAAFLAAAAAGRHAGRLVTTGQPTSSRSITKISVLPDRRCPPPAGP